MSLHSLQFSRENSARKQADALRLRHLAAREERVVAAAARNRRKRIMRDHRLHMALAVFMLVLGVWIGRLNGFGANTSTKDVPNNTNSTEAPNGVLAKNAASVAPILPNGVNQTAIAPIQPKNDHKLNGQIAHTTNPENQRNKTDVKVSSSILGKVKPEAKKDDANISNEVPKQSNASVTITEQVPQKSVNPLAYELIGVPVDGMAQIRDSGSRVVRHYKVGDTLPGGAILTEADSASGNIKTKTNQ